MGGDDRRHILRLHAHVVQDAEGHGGSADVVVVPVNHVADVVHIGGDLAQLDLVLVVAQLRQQVPATSAQRVTWRNCARCSPGR